MKKYRYVGNPVPRVDAKGKVTGKLKYLSDYYKEDMLVGMVLRSEYPHAKIKSIDIEKAKSMNGVHAVLTYKDVPGLNRFGIAIPDMPVLCEDKVRYMGDAVALVAAETEAIALKALKAIKVDYEELPGVFDPEEAISEDAPQVHEKGNLLHSCVLKKGDIEQGLKEADVCVSQTFYTQLFEHAFLETESGFAEYDEKSGILTVGVGSQYVYRDQLQIARAMDMPPQKIRVIGSPCGGAFGGKDEITIQIYLALLTYYTKRPVRMVLSREESIVSGTKRHPFKLEFTVGAKKDGRLTALKLRAVSDTGAYASLGGPVLNLALETAPGPYKIPHTYLEGYAVYTNNGFSGAFRGFGGTQACFGMEICLDMLAEKLNMDKIEFRKINAIKRFDISGIDHKITTSVGIKETLDVVKNHKLYKNRNILKETIEKKYKGRFKYGFGVASEWHACGLGAGLPDFAEAVIELANEGKFLLKQGGIEIGQGNLTAYTQMAFEILNVPIDNTEILHGDTYRTPDSGTVTASRSIYAIGNACCLAALDLKSKIEEFIKKKFSEAPEFAYGYLKVKDKKLSYAELFRMAKEDKVTLIGTGNFIHPVSDKDYGDGLPHWIYTYITQAAGVLVDTKTGEIRVVHVLSVPDVGKAINPQGVEGQSEGGVVMAMGYVLFEEVKLDKGRFLNPDFSTYILPVSKDIPEIETIIVESYEDTHQFGAKGVGEAVTVPIAPAIVNAIYDAIGIRFNKIPIYPEHVFEKLNNSK